MAGVGRSLQALVVALGLVTFGAAAAEFVPGVEDLPLMPGLEAVVDASTSFETPSGRIVEAEARGKGLSEAEVRRFYAGTLPALGWRAVNDRRYERAGERLIIDFTHARDVLTVRFDIRPR
jgi:hypothetical protein